MEMSNPAKDEPLTSKGRLITRKEDRVLHGFGLQSIEEIAEKYEGHVSHRYENGIFTLKLPCATAVVPNLQVSIPVVHHILQYF
jgi:hypothetical protein